VRYIMGVDGGGSKTYAVVVDEFGTKVGSGLGGCGNHQGQGIEKALVEITTAMNQALSQAGLTPSDIDFVQYSLAGADRPKDFSILRPGLGTLPYRNWDVVCDTMGGLRSGSRDYTGVVLVCGAGTNAAGRNPRGQTVQTGGMGYLFGDAAGGYHMARETFRRAMRSWEYRDRPSILSERVAKYLGFDSMGEVFDYYLDHDIYTVPPELTLILHQAGDEGDELAIEILEENGYELGVAANSVIRRLGGFEGRTIPIVLVGSVLQKGRSMVLLSTLEETVRNENPNIEIVIPEMVPVYGAVMLGMDALGIPVTPEMEQRFSSYGGYSD
jgi:N-acetylglucosamine kinase-like BadF-type ATPase